MKTQIGITDGNRQAVVDLLNALLADEYVLYTEARNFHWNVVGPDFRDLHKFFEEQYEGLDDIIDDTAERARALGGNAVATLGEFLKAARLKEKPGQYPGSATMLQRLLEDHEAVIRTLRMDLAACAEKYGDMGTSDFLTGIMEQHEKMAWMARAFLENRS
jgi:starvation-inducible DNA-binding protein